MKKSFIFAIILSAATVCAASTIADSLDTVKSNSVAVCEGIGVNAARVMKMRQSNEPLAKTLRSTEAKFGKAFEHIVLDAYAIPYTQKHQPLTSEVIADFENYWTLECMKALR